jgi:hypothetical protein
MGLMPVPVHVGGGTGCIVARAGPVVIGLVHLSNRSSGLRNIKAAATPPPALYP